MGITYSIRILLSFKYEKKNINYLFQKCLENNIRLYVPFSNLNELNSSGASTRILTMELEDDERYIHAKFQDTNFAISIYKKKNNLLKFSISNFGIMWRKEFINDNYGIDFARYIRLLLRVCKDFTILALETDAF